MTPYLVGFTISSLLVYLAGRCTGTLQKTLLAVGFLLPCLLAGLRGETVGTDVQTYLVWEFQAATRATFATYVQQAASTAPLGYNVIVWVASNITHSLNGVMFALQLPVTGCALCAIWHYDEKSAWRGYLVFLLVLFPISLNAMKQMIAVSVITLSFGLAIDKRPLGFAAVVIVATLFHQTALCSVLLYPFVRSLVMVGNKRAFFGRAQFVVVLFAILVGLALLFVAGSCLVDLLSGLKDSYSYQANATGSRLNYSVLSLTGVCLFVFLLVLKAPGASGPEVRDFGIVSAITLAGCVAMQLNVVAVSLIRLGYYGIAFLPSMVQRASQLETPPRILSFVLIVTCAFYFYIAYIENGGNGIAPYTSDVLLGL